MTSQGDSTEEEVDGTINGLAVLDGGHFRYLKSRLAFGAL
jgi:hypothetical protein